MHHVIKRRSSTPPTLLLPTLLLLTLLSALCLPASARAELLLFTDAFDYPEGTIIEQSPEALWTGRYAPPDPSAISRDGKASLYTWRSLTSTESFINKRDTWTRVSLELYGPSGFGYLLVPNNAMGVSLGFDGTSTVTVHAGNLAAQGSWSSTDLEVSPLNGGVEVTVWLKDKDAQVFVTDALGTQASPRWTSPDITGNIDFLLRLGYGGTYDNIEVSYDTLGPPEAPSPRPPLLVTSSLVEGMINTPYILPQEPWMVSQGVVFLQQVRADNGTQPLHYQVVAGSLPPGLSLQTVLDDPTSDGSPQMWLGELSGTPTLTGSFSFTVRVTDAAGRIDERPYTLVITPTKPPTVSFGESFTGTQGTMIHDVPGSQWTGRYGASSVSATYDQNRAKVGTWGTLTTFSKFRNASSRVLGFGVRAFAGQAGGFNVLCSANTGFGVAVSWDGSKTVTVRSNNLGYAPQTYTDTFSVSPRADGTVALEVYLQGIQSRTYVTGGSGMQATDLRDNSRFAGTCENGDWLVRLGYAGLFDDVWVKDLSAMPEKINPVRVDTTTLLRAYEGVGYRDWLAPGAGTPPFTWSASGLPPGLGISPDGVLSGVPSTPGHFQPTVTVKDGIGQLASRLFTLEVEADPTSSLLWADRFTLPDGLKLVTRDPTRWGSLEHTAYALTYVNGMLEVDAWEQGWTQDSFANDGVEPVAFSWVQNKGRVSVLQTNTCFGLSLEYDRIQHVTILWNNLCYAPQTSRQDFLLETHGEPLWASIEVKGQQFVVKIKDSQQTYLKGPFTAGRVQVGAPVYLHLFDNTPYGEGLYTSYQAGNSYFDDLEVRRGTWSLDAPLPSLYRLEALGRLLFFDPLLSGADDRACASCHQVEQGFADGQVASEGLDGEPLSRNTPGVANLALQRAFFWDGRETSLDAVAKGPLQNPLEMNEDPEVLVAQLAALPEYAAQFEALWPGVPISLEQVSTALGAYTRTLMELGSVYDQDLYRQGTMSEEADAGSILFQGKAGCTTCHALPPVTQVGTTAYHTPLFKVLGVPADVMGSALSPDRGRAAITGDPADEGAFRVPELRNLQRTAPYMHNGVFWTLAEVVHFYNLGGGRGMGLTVPQLSPEIRPLGLSSAEEAQLVAFLEALSPVQPNEVSVPSEVPSGLPVGGDF